MEKRKYFWKNGNVSLLGYRECYKEYMKEEPDEDDICLMIMNEDNQCVGYTSLNWMNIDGGSTGIYTEINEEYRRKGYGTLATEIMLEYAFEERRFHKVQVCTKTNNPGTENFVYQLGFKYEAIRNEMFVIDGKKVTEHYYGMTENEFRSDYRKQLHHKQAPADYMTPIADTALHTVSYVLENTKAIDTGGKVEYTKEDGCYFYDGLKFRATVKEDYLANNEMIYDSQICRWFDDEVKILGFTDQVSEFCLNHTGYKMDDMRLEFAIEEDGRYIGCVSLCGIDSESDREFASIYIKGDCRSKGCGSRAMLFAMAYAEKELGCHNMYTCVSDGNIASAKMMIKIGCTFRGVQREAAYTGGRYVDTMFFEKIQ